MPLFPLRSSSLFARVVVVGREKRNEGAWTWGSSPFFRGIDRATAGGLGASGLRVLKAMRRVYLPRCIYRRGLGLHRYATSDAPTIHECCGLWKWGNGVLVPLLSTRRRMVACGGSVVDLTGSKERVALAWCYIVCAEV